MAGDNASRNGEISAGYKVTVVKGEGTDHQVHSAAYRIPGGTIPAPNVIGCYATGTREVAAGDQLPVVYRKVVHNSVDVISCSAKRIPCRAVPASDTGKTTV